MPDLLKPGSAITAAVRRSTPRGVSNRKTALTPCDRTSAALRKGHNRDMIQILKLDAPGLAGLEIFVTGARFTEWHQKSICDSGRFLQLPPRKMLAANLASQD